MIGKIGRGKKMSIAKAAVVELYKNYSTDLGFVYFGDLGFSHAVIDRAGAEHCGPATTFRVFSCIRQSTLWEGRFCAGFLSGMRGHGGATLFKPSVRGAAYYKHFKLKEATNGKDNQG